MIMRGGSSKGAYFVADELPPDPAERDDVLLRIMGSPDDRQIDGIGGAHPLTSKVAIVSKSTRTDVDLDYLFLQVSVNEALVSDRQNCGNLLSGVAAFAIERELIEVDNATISARVRIHMLNTSSVAEATIETSQGQPVYGGTTVISGVPGTAAAVRLDFDDIAGGTTGALLPTGSSVDVIEGIDCTLIDNGMPVVVLRADALGITGHESCAELEANVALTSKLESIRLRAGVLMNLGDVTDTTVPKLTMVAPPRGGGHLSTRTFIPHRCHDAIGVLGAVSVATAALIPGSPANGVAELDGNNVALEHPSGIFEAAVDATSTETSVDVARAGIVRTARKIMDGIVFPRTA